jgi:hypothetical protein
MNLNYSTGIITGDASFIYEIRDYNTGEILFTQYLGDTHEFDTKSYFILPEYVLNKNIEMRFYIITDQPGKYYLKISEAGLEYP